MDILQREGKYALPPGASTILGVEFSGHIVDVGGTVTRWKNGDEVFGLAAGVCRASIVFLLLDRLWTFDIDITLYLRGPMQSLLQYRNLIF